MCDIFIPGKIEKRALEVWGSEDALREELEKREEKKIVTKSKKYHKEMKSTYVFFWGYNCF